jgi:tetratricopeptide (TPR) repeat protein
MASDQELAATAQDAPRRGGSARTHPAELPRGTTIHRYVLIDKVGQGGMGVVYAAYDQMLHRRVAVKLVASRAGHDDPRLLAEARAMAQLQHAAIVPVHDVGEFSGQLFLAMAFIDGTTLRAWQFADGRSWREIVVMYRQLAEGLAFAHEQGIVHRDFKPDNVLVDDDGRPHITDFGLAKIVAVTEPITEPGTDPGEDAPPDSADTITGTIAGTPGYMSPEQSRGETTDARTDQYAFCVSLFEALHRGLPGSKPPARTDVPRRVLAAIDRGFADDADKRWPAMRALIAELAPPEPPRRRRVMLGAAVIAAGAATWLALRPTHGHETCDVPDANRMWQPARPQVFAHLGKAAGPFVDGLDSWTTRWTDMAQASCRATAAGSQSRQLLDLRTGCLGHALDVASSLVDLALHDEVPASRAPTLASSLPPLEPCADASGLLGIAPLPTEPSRRGVILELRKRTARIEALIDNQANDAARGELLAIDGPVHAIAYPPLTFEMYALRANMELQRGSDPAAAAAAAWSAIAADPMRSDWWLANVWIDLVWIVGEMQHAPREAIEIGRVARTITERVANTTLLAMLDYRLGVMLADTGDLDAALGHFEKARAAYAQKHDEFSLLSVLMGEATVYAARHDTAHQLTLIEEAVKSAEKIPGAHVSLATLLYNLGVMYYQLERFDDAHAALERALATIGTSPDDPGLVAGIHRALGDVLVNEHASDAAEREYQNAIDLARVSVGEDAGETELGLFALGKSQNQRQRFDQALASMRHADEILRRISPDAAISDGYAGPGVVARELVIAHLGLGHASDALASAEASLAFAQRVNASPAILADVHFALASAAWAAGDRARARDAMRLASSEYRESGGDPGEADDWLKAH